MVGTLQNPERTPSVELDVTLAIGDASCRSGRRREILRTTQRRFARRSMIAPEFLMKNPEFYLILRDRDLHEDIENAVFEAGFDDSELTVRGDHVAIWVCHRQGELTDLVR